ncbi:MAG: BrnT family toxin [Chloroflexi bacterium]|nr:BrnT family toxin [Chloroflexota bacterium]
MDKTFEWDSSKAAQNIKKHRISFEEAVTVLQDPLGWTFFDPDHSDDESRFITIGMSERRRLLFVAHTDRENRVRILSARRVTPRERKMYEEEN